MSQELTSIAASSSHNQDAAVEEDWDLISDSDFPNTSPSSNNTDSWHWDFRIQIGALNKSYFRSHNWQVPINYRAPKSEKLLQEQSPLFRLPAELRVRIYEEVLYLGPQEVTIVRRLGPTVLAILQTCARALVEAEEIFYSLNTFTTTSSPSPFLSSISSSRRDAIKSWMIKSPSPPVQELQTLAEGAKNLELLHLRVMQSIKFVNVKNWRVMARNLEMEMEKMECLRGLEVSLMQAKGEREEEREERFREMVRRLSEFVERRRGERAAQVV